MAYVRDRLDELQKRHGEEEKTKNKDDKKEKNDIESFLDKSENIRQWINTIKENSLKADEILENGAFYNSKDLQDELKTLFKNSEIVMLKTSQKLKDIKIDKKQFEKEANNKLKMKYLQYTTLQSCFKEALEDHTACIEKHERKMKIMAQQIRKAVTGSNNTNSDELEELIIDTSGQTQMFTGNYLNETREAQQQLRDIEERHEVLLIIENHLVEVKDLFVQMAILVEQQQESIDRAEHHAEISSNAVELAQKDLKKASHKRKKTKKIKIYLIIGIIVVVVIIILAIIF